MTTDLSVKRAAQAIILILAVTSAAAPPAMAAIVFDGSPGTAAPPATLGPYTMTPFPDDTRPTGNNVTTVPGPVGADLTFNHNMAHDAIGSGWATWSHGYSGDVYDATFTGTPDSVTITLPADTAAFYFYAQPNNFGGFNITATAQGGTTSGPISVNGNAGATYFGFYATAGDTIVTIQVSAASEADGFAVGEFGIAFLPSDLTIIKTATQDVAAGEEVFYTIEVANGGPGGAPEVVVTDTMPPNVEYLADSLAAGTVTYAGLDGQIVEFDLDDIDADEVVSFVVKGRVVPSAVVDEGGIFTAINTAEVATTGDEESLDDNIDTASTFIQESADLLITKIGKPDDEVLAGEVLTYTIIVDNLGPSYARLNVAVKDLIQSSGEFDLIDINSDRDILVRTLPARGDQPSGGHPIAAAGYPLPDAPASGVLDPAGIEDIDQRLEMDCVLVDPLEVLAADGPPNSGRWILTVRVRANETQDINNIATVTCGTPDPDFTNNTAETATAILDTSDIYVTKEVLGEVQVAGQAGQLFDVLDPGAFPAGPNYTTSSTQVSAGRRIRYELTVGNDGPSTATNIVLTDIVPPGVTVLPTPTKSLSPLDPLVFNIGSLPAGVAYTFLVDVLVDPGVPAGTVLTNEIYASSDNFDLDNSDNRAVTRTVVNTWADMEIIKLSVGENVTGYDTDLWRFIFGDLPGQATAGLGLRYEITVQNNGPSDAQNVQILDLLPGQQDTGLTHDPVTLLSSSGADCVPADELQEIGVFGPGGGKFGQLIWCNLGCIPVGARQTFYMSVRVEDTVPDATTLTNGAFAWWGAASPPADPAAFLPFPFPQIPPELPTTDDPYPSDNFASTDTAVDAVADLAIEKTLLTEGPIAPGDTITFDVTITNNGPSVAYDVFFNDVWSGANTPTITPGEQSIPPGESRSWTVTVVVDEDAEAGEEFTNQVTIVLPETTDFKTSNNTDSVTIVVCQLPATPTNVVATNGIHLHTVVVTWDEVVDATSYEVYRNTVPDFDTAQFIGSAVETEYLDYKPAPAYVVTPGCAKPDPTVFYYWVVAVNGCGSSDPSEPDEGYENSLKSAGSLPTVESLIGLALMALALTTANKVRGRRRTV